VKRRDSESNSLRPIITGNSNANVKVTDVRASWRVKIENFESVHRETKIEAGLFPSLSECSPIVPIKFARDGISRSEKHFRGIRGEISETEFQRNTREIFILEEQAVATFGILLHSGESFRDKSLVSSCGEIALRAFSCGETGGGGGGGATRK